MATLSAVPNSTRRAITDVHTSFVGSFSSRERIWSSDLVCTIHGAVTRCSFVVFGIFSSGFLVFMRVIISARAATAKVCPIHRQVAVSPPRTRSRIWRRWPRRTNDEPVIEAASGIFVLGVTVKTDAGGG